MLLSFVLNAVFVTFVPVTISSMQLNPPKDCRKYRFSIIMRFQNENEFHGFGNLVAWLWTSLERLWKFF